MFIFCDIYKNYRPNDRRVWSSVPSWGTSYEDSSQLIMGHAEEAIKMTRVTTTMITLVNEEEYHLLKNFGRKLNGASWGEGDYRVTPKNAPKKWQGVYRSQGIALMLAWRSAFKALEEILSSFREVDYKIDISKEERVYLNPAPMMPGEPGNTWYSKKGMSITIDIHSAGPKAVNIDALVINQNVAHEQSYWLRIRNAELSQLAQFYRIYISALQGEIKRVRDAWILWANTLEGYLRHAPEGVDEISAPHRSKLSVRWDKENQRFCANVSSAEKIQKIKAIKAEITRTDKKIIAIGKIKPW